MNIGVLKSISVFSGVSQMTASLLLQGSSVRSYEKNENIFRKREGGSFYYGIIDGAVSIYGVNSSGEARAFFIFGSGAFLNEEAIYGRHPSVNAKAMRACKMLLVREDSLRSAFAKDPMFGEAFAKSMALKIRRLYHLLKNTSTNIHTGKKIAAKLLKLSRDFGKKTASGIEIDLDIPVSTLAELLGARRETVSRHLAVLRRQGLVFTRGRRFAIPDREKLLDYFYGEDEI